MILSVGCSFTEGAELKDPENNSFPKLIGNEFNLPVKNLGLGGASNDYIFRTVVEETMNTSYDLVIVQWTVQDRIEIIYKNKPFNLSGNSAWVNTPDLNWVKNFYANHHDFNHSVRTWACKVIALQEYFKSKNQKFLFCSMMPLDEHILINEDLIPFWNQIDATHFVGWPNQGLVDWDGMKLKGRWGHPLEDGHKEIAKHINEYIQ